MTRPTSVTICGQPFSVLYLPGLDAQGRTSVAEQTLTIGEGQPDMQERDSVLHEVLHALVKMTGHREDFRGEGEERVVYALATGLLAVLRGNERLVEWLREGVGE